MSVERQAAIILTVPIVLFLLVKFWLWYKSKQEFSPMVLMRADEENRMNVFADGTTPFPFTLYWDRRQTLTLRRANKVLQKQCKAPDNAGWALFIVTEEIGWRLMDANRLRTLHEDRLKHMYTTGPQDGVTP